MNSMDGVGVTFVNGVLGRGVFNGVVNIQFGTFVFTVEGNDVAPDPVVSCRLRMDRQCAQQLYDSLGDLLTLLAAEEAAQATPAPKPSAKARLDS